MPVVARMASMARWQRHDGTGDSDRVTDLMIAAGISQLQSMGWTLEDTKETENGPRGHRDGHRHGHRQGLFRLTWTIGAALPGFSALVRSRQRAHHLSQALSCQCR